VKRRIVFLITELDPGGAERALYELVVRLPPDAYEVAVASLTDEGEAAGWFRREGIEVWSVGMRGMADVRALFRLKREIERRRPHLLHSFLFHANLAGRVAGRMAGVPLILSSVRVEETRWSHLLLDGLTHRLADLEACVSESARRYTAARARVPPEKLVVVPNGVSLARFAEVAPAPAEWGLGDAGLVVAWVGRFDAQKDPLLFLRAAHAVLRRGLNARFVMAGEGPLRRRVEAEARRLGHAERIRLLGRVPDAAPLLKRCSFLVLTSRWEGMPNVVLEAMACSRPVIATAVGGCPEMIRDGVTGCLVRRSCEGTLVERMAGLLGDPGRAAEMGRVARRFVEQHYTIEQTVAAWKAVYDKLFAWRRVRG